MTENIVNLNAPIQNAYLLLTESENRIELRSPNYYTDKNVNYYGGNNII